MFLLGVSGIGCGGVSDDDESLTDRPVGTNLSGEDLSGFETVATLSTAGGSVILSDYTTISVAAGGISSSLEIGLEPLDDPPDVSYDGTAVSGWYRVALSLLDVTASPDVPFIIDVPATPPTEAAGHPGVQLLMVLPGGYAFPIDGIYNAWTGTFRALLPALPHAFDFVVVFNPAIQRLDSVDVPDPVEDTPLMTRAGELGWPTLEFYVDFDGNRVTIVQAKKVAAAARKAARIYSEAGFKQPFLYRDRGAFGERWHIHVASADEGSGYGDNIKPASKDAADHFGRIYVGIDRIDSLPTDELGSLVAVAAHELLHAVFSSYKVPKICFNFIEDGRRWCYPSSIGFDEGMATAAGYMIDQGTAKPRPANAPCKLSTPIGYFDENARHRAYQNQDYYVFLLRTGSLESVRKQMESLAAAVLPAEGTATSNDFIVAYQQALETGGIGVDLTFTEMLGAYVARRGYIRDTEGYLWPDEPKGGEKGAQYVLDQSLFGDQSYKIDATDCEPDELQAVCVIRLKGEFPGAGYLVNMDVAARARDWKFTPGTVIATVTTAGANTTYWLFGEKAGVGSETQTVWSRDGGPHQLSGLDEFSPQIRLLLAQGPAKGMITTTLTFTPAETGPECKILAACCPNIPAGDAKLQCDDLVKKGVESACLAAQGSLLPLCTVAPKQTTCTAQLNNVVTVWDGNPEKVWSVTFSTLGSVQNSAYSGVHTDTFMDFTDTMTASCSGSPSILTNLHVSRVYSEVAVTSDFSIANVQASYGDLTGGSYILTGTTVCDFMQFSGTGLDSLICTADTEFMLDCSSF